MRNILSSETSETNTPESDRKRYVMHDVIMNENGQKYRIKVLAECPIDAQNRVHKMSDETYQGYLSAINLVK